MIKQAWQWIQLWGLAYYSYQNEIVLQAFATVILSVVVIGGLIYTLPEVFARNHG